MINPAKKDLLDAQNWEEIYEMLVSYTILAMRFKKLRNITNAQDVVEDAIDKIYTGVRDWDPNQEPDIRIYLKSVIDSLLDADSKKKENKITTDIDVDLESAGTKDFISNTPTPEEEMIAKELDEMITKEIGDDFNLQLTYEAVKNGIKRKNIEETGLSIKDYDNCIKRLRRIATRLK